jgi:hypothetical protein
MRQARSKKTGARGWENQRSYLLLIMSICFAVITTELGLSFVEGNQGRGPGFGRRIALYSVYYMSVSVADRIAEAAAIHIGVRGA